MAKIICILVRVNIYSRSGTGTDPAPTAASTAGPTCLPPRGSDETGSAPARRDAPGPARFVWRGRLYTVEAILEHWVINREWWQDPEAEPGQPELEFWRVEAASGQGLAAGV